MVPNLFDTLAFIKLTIWPYLKLNLEPNSPQIEILANNPGDKELSQIAIFLRNQFFPRICLQTAGDEAMIIPLMS
jgi:hypothetical protein